ncbi:hypothetical protein MUP46_03815 [Patescibacteria group bacterium]|nr:hypothetical protein [Patescibacteria group bacterium]
MPERGKINIAHTNTFPPHPDYLEWASRVKNRQGWLPVATCGEMILWDAGHALFIETREKSARLHRVDETDLAEILQVFQP